MDFIDYASDSDERKGEINDLPDVDESSQSESEESEEEEEVEIAMQEESEDEDICDDLQYVAQFAIQPQFSHPVDSLLGEDKPMIIDDADSENEAGDGLVEDDDDDDDDSSDEESDVELLDTNKIHRQAAKKVKEWLTEEEMDGLPQGPPKTKHELSLEEVIEPVSIRKVDTKKVVESIGVVLYHIEAENTIVVQAKHTNNPLNEKSLLCNLDGIVLGTIFEVFGPITDPFYIVRLPKKSPKVEQNPADETVKSEEKEQQELSKKDVENYSPYDILNLFPAGAQVYVAPDHVVYITPGLIQSLRSKGSDASNAFDEEPGDDEIEYSDDEKELEAKRSKKKKNANPNEIQTTSKPKKISIKYDSNQTSHALPNTIQPTPTQPYPSQMMYPYNYPPLPSNPMGMPMMNYPQTQMYPGYPSQSFPPNYPQGYPQQPYPQQPYPNQNFQYQHMPLQYYPNPTPQQPPAPEKKRK